MSQNCDLIHVTKLSPPTYARTNGGVVQFQNLSCEISHPTKSSLLT